MKFSRKLFRIAPLMLLAGAAFAQNSGQQFAKDGLSFDYPAGWGIDETKTTAQMQYLTMGREGYAVIIVRSPRGLIDTPEKEAHAKKLIQDGFVDAWEKNFESNGAKAERTIVNTEIGGGPAECTRLTASLSGEPGRVDVCWRMMEKRMVQIAIVGATKDITRTTPMWDTIRNSVKIEPPPAPKTASPKPSPSPGKP
jgi:hypothetical protein